MADTLPMNRDDRFSWPGLRLALLSAVAMTASCRQSSLPPLADDAEVAESASPQDVPLTIADLPPQWVPGRTIAIDGKFEDWEGLHAVAVGNSTYEASRYVRLGRVWTTFDRNWVYFRIELGRVVNVQGLTGTVSLQLDADGNRLTGDIRTGGSGEPGIAGIDFELNFSPRGVNGGFGGVGAEVIEAALPTAPVNPYWLGASFAPTCASDQIELRLARGDLVPGATITPFDGASFAARLTFTDEVGSIVDRTQPFSVALPPLPREELAMPVAAPGHAEGEAPAQEATEPAAPVEEAPAPVVDASAAAAEPEPGPEPGEGPEAGAVEPAVEPTIEPQHGRIARGEPGDVRAVTWNVFNGAIFRNPEPFVRVARALDADIICFQEIGSNTDGGQLESWLNQHLPTNFGWEVRVKPEQGVAVASRLSAVPVESLSGMDGPDAPHVRAASMLVAAADRRVLVTSVHLKCCGRAGDSSDQKRVKEADAIRRLLRAAQYDLQPSGLLVMGDFNLVGSYEPMQIVTFQNDLDASDLLIADPYVRGDATNTTWRDPQQPFLPARLDYAVISDAVFRITQAFVLDTERLSESELARLGLQADDARASDHLPLVVDFR